MLKRSLDLGHAAFVLRQSIAPALVVLVLLAGLIWFFALLQKREAEPLHPAQGRITRFYSAPGHRFGPARFYAFVQVSGVDHPARVELLADRRADHCRIGDAIALWRRGNVFFVRGSGCPYR